MNGWWLRVYVLWRKVQRVWCTFFRKLNHAGSVDGQGNDKDTTFGRHDVEDEFLNLDDIREHKNADLKKNIDGKSVSRNPVFSSFDRLITQF